MGDAGAVSFTVLPAKMTNLLPWRFGGFDRAIQVIL
jgi:hypothetical protein